MEPRFALMPCTIRTHLPFDCLGVIRDASNWAWSRAGIATVLQKGSSPGADTIGTDGAQRVTFKVFWQNTSKAPRPTAVMVRMRMVARGKRTSYLRMNGRLGFSRGL